MIDPLKELRSAIQAEPDRFAKMSIAERHKVVRGMFDWAREQAAAQGQTLDTGTPEAQRYFTEAFGLIDNPVQGSQRSQLQRAGQAVTQGLQHSADVTLSGGLADRLSGQRISGGVNHTNPLDAVVDIYNNFGTYMNPMDPLNSAARSDATLSTLAALPSVALDAATGGVIARGVTAGMQAAAPAVQAARPWLAPALAGAVEGTAQGVVAPESTPQGVALSGALGGLGGGLLARYLPVPTSAVPAAPPTYPGASMAALRQGNPGSNPSVEELSLERLLQGPASQNQLSLPDVGPLPPMRPSAPLAPPQRTYPGVEELSLERLLAGPASRTQLSLPDVGPLPPMRTGTPNVFSRYSEQLDQFIPPPQRMTVEDILGVQDVLSRRRMDQAVQGLANDAPAAEVPPARPTSGTPRKSERPVKSKPQSRKERRKGRDQASS